MDRAFLEAALDLRRTLRTLAAAIVPRFADWCFVDLIDAEGFPRRVEVAHADPAKAPLAQEMRSIGFGPGWATPGAQAIRDRAPRLYRELSNEIMTWATHDERHLAVLRAIKPNSLIAVPLVARDRAIGALTIIRSTMVPALDEQALLFAEELAVPGGARARQRALVPGGARRPRARRRSSRDRERAELIEAQRSQLHLRRLESVAASLSSILSPAAIARVDRRERDVGARAVHGHRRVGDPVGRPPRGPARAGLAGRRRPRACASCAWTRRRSSRRRSASRPRSGSRRRRRCGRRIRARWSCRPASGDRAWAAVPLRVDGRTIGAVALGFPRPRDLDAEERRFVLTIAQLLAQALERARLRDLAAVS